MPGVKGRSGRRPKTAFAATPYLQKKLWEKADRELAELKQSNPDFYATLMDPDGPRVINNEYVQELERGIKREKEWRWHSGRDKKNRESAASFSGPGRLKHAVGDPAERTRLVQKILQWQIDGRSLNNIGMLATRFAGKAISVKTIAKLLKDLGKA